jgi:predicted nucleic acid-binding protein
LKVYVDTNLVVTRTLSGQGKHSEAVEFFSRIREQDWLPVISSHGIVEVYSVLSRMPLPYRLSPADAWQTIEANLLPMFEIVELSMAVQLSVVRDCSRQGLAGGLVYDALHMAAARNAGCERIYTYNVKHFRQVAPDLHDRIMLP